MKEINPNIVHQFHLIQAIRSFFNERGFMDVMTPPMVQNPGMEVHIHPFKISQAIDGKGLDRYLHTSPEFHMKELLSSGLEKIFNISYCFRNEPDSPIHRDQFLMLEWYRAHENYESIMKDMRELFEYCCGYLEKLIDLPKPFKEIQFETYTVQEIIQEFCHFDILNYLELDSLYEKIQIDFKDVPLPDKKHLAWDDCFFLLFLNKIERELEKKDFVLIKEYPAPLAALSTLKKSDPRVCERFEVYYQGIELCNCFNELTDLKEQKERFKNQAKEKNNLYDYQLPSPNVLYHALEKGMPHSSGVALGIERLLKAITGLKNPFYY